MKEHKTKTWFKNNQIKATLSRTFFFVDSSLFMYGRHRIWVCCFNSAHWLRFFRNIDFVVASFSLFARVWPDKLYSIFCAQFWYCFSEKSVWLTRLRIISVFARVWKKKLRKRKKIKTRKFIGKLLRLQNGKFRISKFQLRATSQHTQSDTRRSQKHQVIFKSH